MRNALRWIAVLPAAVGGYIAAVLFVAIGFAMVPNDSMYFWVSGAINWLFGLNTESRGLAEEIVSAFFRAFGFVLAGAKVAPSHRVQTALALSGICIAIFMFIFGAIASTLINAMAQTGQWRSGLYLAFYMALVVWGLVYAVRETQKEVRETAWLTSTATATQSV